MRYALYQSEIRMGNFTTYAGLIANALILSKSGDDMQYPSQGWTMNWAAAACASSSLQ